MMFGIVGRWVAYSSDDGEAYWKDESPLGYETSDLEENESLSNVPGNILRPDTWPTGTRICILQPDEDNGTFETVGRYIVRNDEDDECYWENASPSEFNSDDFNDGDALDKWNTEMWLPGDYPEATRIIILQEAH